MLSPETKRKIDNCRDTLVGKIPVPMSQIEQITLALTYKFMSDIDEENRELGGASFFEDEFEKFAWKNVMDKRNGAQERLSLYSDGLESMSRNKNVPELFRDIFRNAYLPFKNPSTLDRFLKQINEFHYEHSEELWNAFEYLLSTAGSQGDAGQFRTPRHIIEFLVSAVDPTKEDTILDPACGTAGFLISAYKHILDQNSKNLSIEEKRKISKNITGYDISHDMVRLSLVNMYLHNFADPKIFEYDTLSSEDRWNEDFDCILANPPFMTPKGGIQPHKRFSINATKSEVLFVDYIMEHLKINGKAGIIVPEGVIFQSGNAYKELRKKMVNDNFLWAVVSLPSGIFQPYSGVKTSILLFDRQLAKKTDKVLFIKVATDGFDLGAQRREIQKNDLPEALEILYSYKETLEIAEFHKNLHPLLVEKSKIADSGDWNLSGEKYRVSTILQNSKFEMVELGELCDILNGYAFDSSCFNDQAVGMPLIRIRDVNTWLSGTYYNWEYDEKYIIQTWDFLIWMDWDFKATQWKHWAALLNQRVCKLYNFRNTSKEFVYFLIQKELDKIHKDTFAVTVKHLSSSQISKIKIPLPHLDIQDQIVAELDRYQKIIDGARQVVKNYKPAIKTDPSWEMVECWKIFELTSWKFLPSKNVIQWEYSVYGWNWINNYHNEYFLENPTIVIWRVWEYCWAVHITKPKSWVTDNALYVINFSRDINQSFLFLMLARANINQYAKQWGQPSISQSTVKDIKIPLPPIEIQEQIVAWIEAEQMLVDATKELIALYEGKINERIGEIWGESISWE